MRVGRASPGECSILARLIACHLRARWRQVPTMERIGWSLGVVFAGVTAAILLVSASNHPQDFAERIGHPSAQWEQHVLRWTLAGGGLALLSVFYSNAIQAIIQSDGIQWLLLSPLSVRIKVGYLLFETVSRSPLPSCIVILTVGCVSCVVVHEGWMSILVLITGLPLFGGALLAACFLSCLTLRIAARLQVTALRILPLLQFSMTASVWGLAIVGLHARGIPVGPVESLWVLLPSTSLADGLLSLKYGDFLEALGLMSSYLTTTLVSAALCYHGSSKLWPNSVLYSPGTVPFSQSFRTLAARIRPGANRTLGWFSKDILELLRDPHYRYALLVFPLVCIVQALVQHSDLRLDSSPNAATPTRHMMMWSLTGTYLIPLFFTGHASYPELRVADLFRTILPDGWLRYKAFSQTTINGVFALVAAVPFFAFLEPGFRRLEVGFFVLAVLFGVPVMTMFVLGLAVLCSEAPGPLFRVGISSAGIFLYLSTAIAAYSFALALYEDLAFGRPLQYRAAILYFILFTIVAGSSFLRAMKKTARRR